MNQKFDITPYIINKDYVLCYRYQYIQTSANHKYVCVLAIGTTYARRVQSSLELKTQLKNIEL